LKAIVVTPTYNEAENLPELVEAILSLNLDNLEVLIVDDNSPDGTGQIADQLAERHPHKIEVIHRQGKLGLGTAYVTGFTRALEKGAEAIIEMDADLSHPPESIPRLLEKIEDHDVVIGSRYIPEGKVDPDLPPWRGFLSRTGNSYVRLITGLRVHDATSGFRCFKREVLQGIDLRRVRSTNYAFQIEMAYSCQRKGYRLVEIPISFRARSRGKSKISWSIIWEALWRAWEIRLRH
jgi:dolichol-phosphate mannosyltransferase